MSKDLPARYYQKNKERIEKKSQERIKIFLQKEKTENKNMVVNNIKISHKPKNKDKLILQKYIMKCKVIKRLMFYNNTKKTYKKNFNFSWKYKDLLLFWASIRNFFYITILSGSGWVKNLSFSGHFVYILNWWSFI